MLFRIKYQALKNAINKSGDGLWTQLNHFSQTIQIHENNRIGWEQVHSK
jgi:hypothetical protein